MFNLKFVRSWSGCAAHGSCRRKAPRRSAGLSVESLEQRSLLDAHGFVNGLYQELLHRSPAQAEVEDWVGDLNAGASREQIAQGFTASQEYRSIQIHDSYHGLLERDPEPGAVDAWLARMQEGMKPEQLAGMFLDSDEYFEKHGGNSRDWLESVYHDVLDRASDEGGAQAWLQAMENGLSRGEVASRFIESSEAHHGEVRDAYLAHLGREPEETGENQWVDALDEGMSHEDLLERIVSTSEYDDDHLGGDSSSDGENDQSDGSNDQGSNDSSNDQESNDLSGDQGSSNDRVFA